MSLQNLISGAECALPANPLSQVLKHTEGDRTIQRDRLAGPSSSRLQHLPSTSIASLNEGDLALARQFFQSNAPMGGASGTPLMRPYIPSSEYANRMGGGQGPPGFDMESLWMQSALHSSLQRMPDQPYDWKAEFQGVGSQYQEPSTNIQLLQRQDYPPHSHMSSQHFRNQSMPMNMHGMGMYQQFPPIQEQGKGKGKMRDRDFDAMFAELDASMSSQAKIEEVDGLEAAMLNARLDSDDLADSGPELSTDFQKAWDEMQRSEIPPPKEDMAKWESEFSHLMQSQREELDYTSQMQSAWEGGTGDYDQGLYSTPPLKFDDEGIPVLGEYVFETNNDYLQDNIAGSRLDRAKTLLAHNGSLTQAALLLEAAIQKGELGQGGYEAWILLGETRSMDEREEAAMRALQEGVRRAEEAHAGGAGMLSLATAYTNESYEKGSHTMLMRWLMARFPYYTPPSETTKSLQQNPWDSYQRVTDAFLDVARQQHAEGIVDADVQTGLGVLFYTNRDYERARDCFDSALSARPQDYLLWNRLGSSLSNGNKPEEALGAYREALNLRPTYTRAIYNVGVACLNIGANKEAVEHFLSALTLQDNTEGEKSEQIWFTLRRAFGAMNREDLASKAQAGASVEAFRSEGFDF